MSDGLWYCVVRYANPDKPKPRFTQSDTKAAEWLVVGTVFGQGASRLDAENAARQAAALTNAREAVTNRKDWRRHCKINWPFAPIRTSEEVAAAMRAQGDTTMKANMVHYYETSAIRKLAKALNYEGVPYAEQDS